MRDETRDENKRTNARTLRGLSLKNDDAEKRGAAIEIARTSTSLHGEEELEEKKRLFERYFSPKNACALGR
jgi:hypothetical protein